MTGSRRPGARSLAILLVPVLSLAGATAQERKAQELEPLAPGAEAPAFQVTALDGRIVTSAELTGDRKERNVLVVVFWAYTCPWVHRWNPALQAALEAFREEPRVRFVIVDPDRTESRSPDAITRYLEENKFRLPVHLDPGQRAADAFGASTTPHCFVVGTDGRIAYSGRINDRSPMPPAARIGAASSPETEPAEVKPEEPPKPLLELAIKAALAGKALEIAEDAPMGCRVRRD
jgi:peroxiredoxin